MNNKPKNKFLLDNPPSQTKIDWGKGPTMRKVDKLIKKLEKLRDRRR